MYPILNNYGTSNPGYLIPLSNAIFVHPVGLQISINICIVYQTTFTIVLELIS